MPSSHVEIAGALRQYAAGLLAGDAEAVVRRHLATGCRECLGTLFRAPVGRGRSVDPPDAGGSAWAIAVAAVAVVALTGTVLASAMLFGTGRPVSVAESSRDLRTESLTGRVALAERRLEGLGARSERLATAVGRALEAPAGRPAPAGMRSAGGSARGARALAGLAAALTAPSTRLAPLRPQQGSGLPHGWTVWDPLRGRLYVYATGLPPLPSPWEARVERGDVIARVVLRRLADGGAWGVLDVSSPHGCGGSVWIVPPDAERVVLRGTVPCARPRA